MPSVQRPSSLVSERTRSSRHPYGLALPSQQASEGQRGSREQSGLVCRREGSSFSLSSVLFSRPPDRPPPLSRSQDWIKDASISPDSFLPSSTANPSSTDTSGAGQQSGLTPAARAALSKKFVVQPADPEVAARGCPICKEPFKGEFSEDEEEWIWKNAVEHEGVASRFLYSHVFASDN